MGDMEFIFFLSLLFYQLCWWLCSSVMVNHFHKTGVSAGFAGYLKREMM